MFRLVSPPNAVPRAATVRFLCDMRHDDRVRLARETYLRTVAAARASSTATSWKRLLRASQNLKAAMRERERGRIGIYVRSLVGELSPRASGAPPPHAEPFARRPDPTRPPEAGGAGRGEESAAAPEDRRRPSRWVGRMELEREWERARSLVDWSKRLVEESRALTAALRAIMAGRHASSPAAR